jgi:sugar phosphate isomerase/epimerase
MQFACHTWGFNDLSLTDALGTIARLGFRYVDLGTGPHLNVAEIVKDPRGVAAQIKRDLQLFNLKLSDFYLMAPRISLADEAKRAQDINTFKAMLPFVIALETPGVTLSPGLTHPADEPEALDRSVSALREMVAAAGTATPATRLQVSIEPHVDSMAQSPDAIRKILGQVKGLSLTLDWAEMVYQDVFHDQIAELIPHARHIQIRQGARAQLQTPFTQGRIDIQRVVKSLKDADYDGVVCVELIHMEHHGAIKVEPIPEAVKLRDALRSARDELETTSTMS